MVRVFALFVPSCGFLNLANMNLMDNLTTAIRCPQVFRPYGNIFLLSHMRANTSLFGHILGSNTEIQGYYEMHIGYYGWKSLVRQKLLYFSEHQPKPGARYMFDKVLHTEHFVSPDVLERDNSKVVFMLRRPEQTLPSIIKLYQRVDSKHPFCTPDAATHYYVSRVKAMADIAKSLSGKYLYLDAESLKDDTQQSLVALTRFLELSLPLTEKYEIFQKTGKGGSGDSSENMKAGTIVRSSTAYELEQFSQAQLSAASETYLETRELLRRS